MTDYSLDWYLLTTFPSQEDRAKMNLGRLGMCSWRPSFSRIVRQNRERRFVDRALFPGYLFLGVEQRAVDWMAVRDAPGVYGVLCCDGVPERIPSEVVVELMSRCLTGYFDEEQRRIGSKVRVARGLQAGVLGRIVKAVEGEDPTVLLTLCGTPRYEQIPLDALRIAA